MSDCERCKMLEQLLEDAETANAELGRQRAGLELLLRRSGMTEVALRRELSDQREEEPEAVDIRDVCDHWKFALGKTGRTKTPLTGKRAKAVRARLRERFTVDDLKKAIDGCAKFPYVTVQGRKPTGAALARYDDLELICRDEVTVERFMRLADQDPVEDAATTQPPSPQDPRPALRSIPTGPTGVDAILVRLEGVKQVRPGQWEAKCSAHEDRHASLSIGQGDKGAVLHCHAGCSTEAIVASAGIELTRLFDPEDRPATLANPKPAPEALPTAEDIDRMVGAARSNRKLLERLYELRKWRPATLAHLKVGFDGQRLTLPVYDDQGQLVNVLRYLPRRVGDQRKLLAARGRPRNLWPAPETVRGDLWLVEGEPDAISGWELGLPTIAIPGANGWNNDWAKRLADRRITICLDCDDPGRKLADKVLVALAAVADVRVLDLEPERTDGYDLSDALLEGADREILTALSDAIVTQQAAA